MAYTPDWDIGTITLANGGTTVTGQNTAWDAGGIKAGDLLLRNNRSAVILSVEDATHLTLAEPWDGLALNAQPYRIRIQDDASALAPAVRQLVRLLGEKGNLEALAGLVSAANKMPYFTGAGQAGVTDLSAKARELIGAADTAAMRTVLGALAASSYTAADVLAKLLTVDGAGSGLDSDTLRNVTPTTLGLNLLAVASQANAKSLIGYGPRAFAGSNSGAITVGTGGAFVAAIDFTATGTVGLISAIGTIEGAAEAYVYPTIRLYALPSATLISTSPEPYVLHAANRSELTAVDHIYESFVIGNPYRAWLYERTNVNSVTVNRADIKVLNL